MTSAFKHKYPRFLMSRSNKSLSCFIGGDPSFMSFDQSDLRGLEERAFLLSRPFHQQEFRRSFGAVDRQSLSEFSGFDGYGLVPPLALHGFVPPVGKLEFGGFVPGRAV